MFDNINKESDQSNNTDDQGREAPAEPDQSGPDKAEQEADPVPKEFSHDKAEVEDILSETEKDDIRPEKPVQLQPKEPAEDEAALADQGAEKTVSSRPAIKKILIIVGLIIGLGLVGVFGFWGYKKFIEGAKSEVEEEGQAEQQLSDIGTESAETGESKEMEILDEIIEEQLLDSDQDGLADEEEKALGLDINNVDSDNDGLFDREEVQVYQTDPLNQDTDGDGFLDGEEVKDGYNPRGAGKLYELK